MRAFLTLCTVCISSSRTICAFLRSPALLCASLRLYTLLDYRTRYGGRSRIHTLELTSPVPPLLLCAPLRFYARLCAPLRFYARLCAPLRATYIELIGCSSYTVL